MSSRSLNEILIKSPTELFDLVFAAYNLSFISPRVVYVCTRRDDVRDFNSVLYLPFYIRGSSIAQKTCPRSLRSLPY